MIYNAFILLLVLVAQGCHSVLHSTGLFLTCSGFWHVERCWQVGCRPKQAVHMSGRRAVFGPLIIISYSLLQKISNSNSLGAGQSFFRYHMKGIYPACTGICGTIFYYILHYIAGKLRHWFISCIEFVHSNECIAKSPKAPEFYRTFIDQWFITSKLFEINF